jgi:hypothetical protein
MGDDVDELDATEDDAAWERFLGQPDAMPLGPTVRFVALLETASMDSEPAR